MYTVFIHSSTSWPAFHRSQPLTSRWSPPNIGTKMRWGRKLRLTRASGKHLLSQRKFVQDSPTPPRKRQRFCISCFGLRTQPKMGPVTKAYRSRCWRHECRLIGARACTRQQHIFSAPTPRPECFGAATGRLTRSWTKMPGKLVWVKIPSPAGAIILAHTRRLATVSPRFLSGERGRHTKPFRQRVATTQGARAQLTMRVGN